MSALNQLFYTGLILQWLYTLHCSRNRPYGKMLPAYFPVLYQKLEESELGHAYIVLPNSMTGWDISSCGCLGDNAQGGSHVLERRFWTSSSAVKYIDMNL